MLKESQRYLKTDNLEELGLSFDFEEYLNSKQKRAIEKMNFNKVEYSIGSDYNNYYNQKIIVYTKSNKKVVVSFHLIYDSETKKIFIKEDGSDILYYIKKAIGEYNEDLTQLKRHITYLSNEYSEDVIKYEEDTVIRLLNIYYLKDIITDLNSYYRIQSDTNTSLSIEGLVDALDLL